jgi:hypothetical protein
MIELNASCTALLWTTRYKTTAKATAAMVPTAYSAVVIPTSSLIRRLIRLKNVMSAAKRSPPLTTVGGERFVDYEPPCGWRIDIAAT